jgi:hypothetical protein
MLKEVRLENTKWDFESIEYSAQKLISYYAKTLPIMGTKFWINYALEGLLPVLRKQSRPSVSFDAHGFSLVFLGPNQFPTPVIEGKAIIYRQAEPRFLFFDQPRQLTPRLKNLLYYTSRGIAEEMSEVYKLKVSTDPVSYIFPRDEYSLSVEQERAHIIP